MFYYTINSDYKDEIMAVFRDFDFIVNEEFTKIGITVLSIDGDQENIKAIIENINFYINKYVEK